MTVSTQTDLQDPQSAYKIIQEKISNLQESLLTQHPTMPTLLRDIHVSLKADPAVVTLCTEEEICVIVQGLEKQTNTFLAESMTKTKSGAAKKALSKVSVDDLF